MYLVVSVHVYEMYMLVHETCMLGYMYKLPARYVGKIIIECNYLSMQDTLMLEMLLLLQDSFIPEPISG